MNFVGAVVAAGRARLHFHVLGTFQVARWLIKSALRWQIQKKKTTKANTAQRKGRDTERKREGVWSGGCVRGVIKKNLAHGRDTRQDKNQVTWRRQSS